jgi:hypothetical protein
MGYADAGLTLTSQVQLSRLADVPVDHLGRNVRHVLARVALPRDEDLELLHAEQLLEVLEEVHKVLGDVQLVRRRHLADGEPGADRLFDPQHVGEVDPRVRVDLRRVLAPRPLEQAVLLQETFEGAAAGAAVQPDGDLVHGLADGGLEDEVECSGGVVLVNGDEPRVHFTHIKGNVGHGRHSIVC